MTEERLLEIKLKVVGKNGMLPLPNESPESCRSVIRDLLAEVLRLRSMVSESFVRPKRKTSKRKV